MTPRVVEMARYHAQKADTAEQRQAATRLLEAHELDAIGLGASDREMIDRILGRAKPRPVAKKKPSYALGIFFGALALALFLGLLWLAYTDARARAAITVEQAMEWRG